MSLIASAQLLIKRAQDLAAENGGLKSENANLKNQIADAKANYAAALQNDVSDAASIAAAKADAVAAQEVAGAVQTKYDLALTQIADLQRQVDDSIAAEAEATRLANEAIESFDSTTKTVSESEPKSRKKTASNDNA